MNNHGFPELSESFLMGQDILYRQFNDINFYVEDINSENFYFNILKKIFDDLKFEKIFPLCGKRNVTEAAINNSGDKNKIYLLDKDFDDLLDKKLAIPNLFYLERYSIENFLLKKEFIYEIIRIKHPKLKNNEIDEKFNFNSTLEDAFIFLKEISIHFLIIQKYKLDNEYFKLIINRDFERNNLPPYYKGNLITNYFIEIRDSLFLKNKRIVIQRQISNYKKHFKNDLLCLKNIPGKYILSFIKQILISNKLINQYTDDSFTYLLSKEFEDNSLDDLKNKILEFRNMASIA